MHILIAPNAFKNSLTAPEVAKAIAEGLLEGGFTGSMECFPVGDGGDGTASLIVQRFGEYFIDVESHDPLGRKMKASVGLIDQGTTAVIEMADTSGLKLLKQEERDPMHATSFCSGELIRAALDQGVRKIILGVGGSATIDGGSGALQAMGVRFLDQSGNEILGLPENLTKLETIDICGIDQRIFGAEFIVLCDVDNFLLGEKGAASVFGPQKGASANQVFQLESGLERLRDVTFRQTGSDMNSLRHGGAAGGISAALNVFLNARLVQGIEYFLDMSGFDNNLEKTDILITGEGSIDAQTLEGKAPYGVARRAKKKNISVIGLSGSIPSTTNKELDCYFDVLLSINEPDEDFKTSILHTAENLRRTSCRLCRSLDSVLKNCNVNK